MAKHTPGPWVAVRTRSGSTLDAMDQYSIGHQSPGNSGPIFCTVDATHVTPEARERAEANARLIAAAPDMLESLRGIVRTVNHLRAEMPEAAAALFRLDLSNAHEAIAKAEGA